MLDIQLIREHTEAVKTALQARGASIDIDALLEVDRNRRAILTKVEALKNRRNVVSKEIGALKQAGKDTEAVQRDMRSLGEQIAALDQESSALNESLQQALLLIPNCPHASVPVGSSAADNVVERVVGQAPAFDFEPLSHVEIGERLGLLDFERGARMSGAGFPVYVGRGARLERALIQFMLDLHTREHGYTEIAPPFVVNRASMTGTGQLPNMAGDMYHAEIDDLWLIPTAEVPVTNFFREEIIRDPLPICLTAYSPCFRREAGAAGKETRGLIRIHQFDKVELVRFVQPESSYAELERLVSHAEAVLQRLELHYRVVQLCTGDLSFSAAKCYDIELWAPGQKAWLEVSSCSNFEDFQARRARIRYRRPDGKTALVHTLNGSGVALPRLVVALLESNQQADGSVKIPVALQPYMDGCERLEPGS